VSRARVTLVLFLALSSLVSAVAASLLLGTTFALLTGGPLAIPGGIVLGALGLSYSILPTLLPALLLGGLLWLGRIRRRAIWAAAGALAGLVCFSLITSFTADLREALSAIAGQNRIEFGLACAIAGALAALLFRTLMRLFTAYDEALTID